MIRTAFALLVFVLITLFCGGVVVAASLLGVTDTPGGVYDRMSHLWGRVLNWACGVTLVLHDAHHMDGYAPRVFIANHTSVIDIFSLIHVLPHQKFVAKSELRRIPFFDMAATAWGVVWIERENHKSAMESYRRAAEAIRAGVSVAVFPEGTRGDEYALRSFKKGPFVLAIEAGAPVVPVVVYGAREVQSRTRFTVRPGTVHVHFMPPIPTAGLTYDDRAGVALRTRDAMVACLQREYGITSPPSDRARPDIAPAPAPA